MTATQPSLSTRCLCRKCSLPKLSDSRLSTQFAVVTLCITSSSQRISTAAKVFLLGTRPPLILIHAISAKLPVVTFSRYFSISLCNLRKLFNCLLSWSTANFHVQIHRLRRVSVEIDRCPLRQFQLLGCSTIRTFAFYQDGEIVEPGHYSVGPNQNWKCGLPQQTSRLHQGTQHTSLRLWRLRTSGQKWSVSTKSCVRKMRKSVKRHHILSFLVRFSQTCLVLTWRDLFQFPSWRATFCLPLMRSPMTWKSDLTRRKIVWTDWQSSLAICNRSHWTNWNICTMTLKERTRWSSKYFHYEMQVLI